MNAPLSLADQFDMLQEENRQLRARIAALTGADQMMLVQRAFGTSALQSKVICYLLARGEARREHLIDHCYPVDQQERCLDIGLALACLMKHVRAALRQHGIEFESVYGLGWEMSEKNRADARKVMAAAGDRYFTGST